ncbi:DUF5329 domain-containing protein [Pseudoduganella sp.]|uniref:DUF5329 domain-containing protein n=1 Tax=Pseudoduganella sp. TaxID=1880898 RepID=UPI0035B41CF1
MRRTLTATVFAIAASAAALAPAAPLPAPARAEVDALLGRLQASGCQFNRNGTWYSGAEAKDHLQRKLEYLEKKDMVRSAEQFIELGATASSSSGKAYTVRCGGAAPVESKTWLGAELKAIRAR